MPVFCKKTHEKVHYFCVGERRSDAQVRFCEYLCPLKYQRLSPETVAIKKG